MPAEPISVPPVPHAPDDLEVIVRKVLADLAVVEPISVDEPTAAKMVGVCGKTLSGLPAEQTGRAKIGRRTVYLLERLREFVKSQIAK